jgi:RNA polymerase sigma factor (sigma-70 family)
MKESLRQLPRPPEQEGAPRLEAVSDDWLLGRLVLHQDQAAFEALWWRHGPMVRAVCRRWVGDGHAAEDACQETFLVLFRKAHAIGKPALLAGWLFGVASRIAQRAQTKPARRWIHEHRVGSDQVADPAVEVARRELCTIVAAAVNDLPEGHRAALILHYWEGKTCEEIAGQLGCPTGSMSWLLGRGRELLRRRLRALGKEIAL